MRQVAKHIWVKELLDGEYEQKEGWEPNILHTARGEVSRVNIIGTYLTSQSQDIIDDGTGQMTLRSFEPVPGINTKQGTMVQLIGRPRQYGQQLYLVPEVIREIDAVWAQVRKEELGAAMQYDKKHVVVTSPPQTTTQGESEDISDAEKIIDIIASLDTGGGADVQQVIDTSLIADAENIIEQLLIEGEIFEIKPGMVKVL